MTNKFKQSAILQNLSSYNLSNRHVTGLMLIFNIIKYFNCRRILEIGFSQGLTFGTMLEATESGSVLHAVDIELDTSLYDQYYRNSQHADAKQIQLLEMDSEQFVPTQLYDFINVDGDHDYPKVLKDLTLAANALAPNGIIMVDDFTWSGVNQSINKFLNLNTNLVPFLCDGQAMYFHHVEHAAGDFLDQVLPEQFQGLCTLYDREYKSCTVKFMNHWPILANNLVNTLVRNQILNSKN